MDLLTALAILASLATIAGLLYIALIGQKSIPEWLRETRAKRSLKAATNHAATEAPVLESTNLKHPHRTNGEQMLAIMKLTEAPGLNVTTKSIPSIGPKDVLVSVTAASIGATELEIYEWNRWVPTRVHPPVVPGLEFCGVIVERGQEVTEVAIGDFVAAESHVSCGKCSYCVSGYSNVCPSTQMIGISRDGAFAEYIAIPATNAWKLPSDMPAQIAAIMEPFGNAVHAALSQDLANRNVLITGCGSVGLMAIAIAKWAGARLICVSDMSDFRLKLAERMGANILLCAQTTLQDNEKVVLESTQGQGIDVFLEMSSSPSALSLGLAVLRNAGRAVLMGIRSEPVEFDVAELVTRKGVTIYGAAGRRSDQTWERMRNVLATGSIDLRPLITHEFPLDEIDKAMALVQSREAGKVIYCQRS